MHIAFVNPQGNFDPKDSYWTEHPDFGGQLVYVKEVAIAIARRGHKVDILTRQIIDPDWREFAAPLDAYPGVDNLRIIRLPCGPQKFLAKVSLWPYLGTDWVANIIAFYQQENTWPDIFTTHYGDGGLTGAVLQDQSGTPFTFTGHSLGAQKMDKLHVTLENLEQMEERYRFSKRIMAERLSMNHAARIFVSTSQEQQEQYSHKVYSGAVDPSDSQKFAATPPGVNRKIFSEEVTDVDSLISQRIKNTLENHLPHSRHNLSLVVNASRLDPKKNLISVVRAFATSQALQDAANLVIGVRGVNDPLANPDQLKGSEQVVIQEVIDVIGQHDLQDKVFTIELNSQLELAAAYRHAAEMRSVFILAALYEPFGLAPLEAMSCGLPAVATRNGGPTESLREDDNEYGVLVDPSDPQDIANGILRLVNNNDTWLKFHQAGIQRVIDKYTWQRTAEGYLKEFETIIKDKQSGINSIDIPDYFTNPDDPGKYLMTELKKLYFGGSANE